MHDVLFTCSDTQDGLEFVRLYRTPFGFDNCVGGCSFVAGFVIRHPWPSGQNCAAFLLIRISAAAAAVMTCHCNFAVACMACYLEHSAVVWCFFQCCTADTVCSFCVSSCVVHDAVPACLTLETHLRTAHCKNGILHYRRVQERYAGVVCRNTQLQLTRQVVQHIDYNDTESFLISRIWAVASQAAAMIVGDNTHCAYQPLPTPSATGVCRCAGPPAAAAWCMAGPGPPP
jgi:hypothetical protein